jgi:CHAD domain-containing protein
MPNMQSLFEELRIVFAEAVVSCRVESTEKTVHAVRTGSRRLEALLGKALEDHRGATGLHRESKGALKQLGKIRKMAGSVRDPDVQRKLLAEITEELSARKAAVVREAMAEESERLDDYLKRRRQRGADALRVGLTKRELKVERALERTVVEMKGLTADAPSPLVTAREWTRRSAAKLGELNEGNLHDFRKRTKAARYVAELQKESLAAKRFAAELHRVQDSIGQWHDWELLSQLAEEVLGKESAMVNALTKKRDRALGVAVRSARVV